MVLSNQGMIGIWNSRLGNLNQQTHIDGYTYIYMDLPFFLIKTWKRHDSHTPRFEPSVQHKHWGLKLMLMTTVEVQVAYLWLRNHRGVTSNSCLWVQIDFFFQSMACITKKWYLDIGFSQLVPSPSTTKSLSNGPSSAVFLGHPGAVRHSWDLLGLHPAWHQLRLSDF